MGYCTAGNPRCAESGPIKHAAAPFPEIVRTWVPLSVVLPGQTPLPALVFARSGALVLFSVNTRDVWRGCWKTAVGVGPDQFATSTGASDLVAWYLWLCPPSGLRR